MNRYPQSTPLLDSCRAHLFALFPCELPEALRRNSLLIHGHHHGDRDDARFRIRLRTPQRQDGIREISSPSHSIPLLPRSHPDRMFAAAFYCLGLPARFHEITAIKSGGISPQRTAIPLLRAPAALSDFTLSSTNRGCTWLRRLGRERNIQEKRSPSARVRSGISGECHL